MSTPIDPVMEASNVFEAYGHLDVPLLPDYPLSRAQVKLHRLYNRSMSDAITGAMAALGKIAGAVPAQEQHAVIPQQLTALLGNVMAMATALRLDLGMLFLKAIEKDEASRAAEAALPKFHIDREALICAVDWLADDQDMAAIIDHLRARHKVLLLVAEIKAEIERASSTWPAVRDSYRRA